MRLLLAGNPASGSGRGAKRLETALESLRRAGAQVELLRTLRRGHAREEVARRHAEFDRVVACGGDGLVSEVASALAGTGTPLAVVPAGRGNDLARGLGVPRDVAAAAALAATGSPRPLDLGSANGRTFCTVAACGLDAEVSRGARESRLPLPGPGVYLVELMRQLVRMPRLRARLLVDGRRIEDDLMVLAVANTPTYGGGFLIAPGASPEDGLLDACAIRATSRLRALSLLSRVMPGRHVGLPEVTLLRARRLELACEPEADVEADGEALARTPVVFEALPGALSVVRP